MLPRTSGSGPPETCLGCTTEVDREIIVAEMTRYVSFVLFLPLLFGQSASTQVELKSPISSPKSGEVDRP